ncbi:hypothetical protein BS50DRAFT_508309 [Corynespora cassiicola Philippines]|uniref:Uncharacterized protein n=1 Tax=Corynespora cassiicola Philippines TaxID=1448308 RepID=A0A2T2N294_CORCC|nr:hypothetical protein BS50DRAFT_508309 [Corynespora cassiicola Philippines]
MDNEILVHISAPTTLQTDDLYRSLADAYLDFEPHQPGSPGGHEEGTGRQDATAREQATEALVDVSMANTSKDSYGSFPSEVASDVQSHVHNGSTVYGSFGSIDDSVNPMSRLGQLEQLHSNWRKQQTLRTPSASTGRRSDGQSAAIASPSGFIDDTQLAAQAIESQIHDSNSTTSEERSEEEEEAAVVLDAQHLVSQDASKSAELEDVTIATQPSQHPLSAEVDVPDSEKNAEVGTMRGTQTSAPPDINPSHSSVQRADARLETLDFSSLSTEVYSPMPQVSTKRPKRWPTQVTSYLLQIKTQKPHRFKPCRQARKLRKDERCIWRIQCAEWHPDLQYEFWETVADHIRQDDFGSVNMFRDQVPASGLGQVDLMCYGEVVEHIWLALLVFSRGKVCGSARLLDAGENVIVDEVR